MFVLTSIIDTVSLSELVRYIDAPAAFTVDPDVRIIPNDIVIVVSMRAAERKSRKFIIWDYRLSSRLYCKATYIQIETNTELDYFVILTQEELALPGVFV
jgi:hypothetical protein